MNTHNYLDELFQQPLALPDNDAMTAQIMREAARAERRRKVLLVGSGCAGTGIAMSIVLSADVLPAIFSRVLPTLGSHLGRISAELITLESPSGSAGLWVLTAASLIIVGLAARFIHES